jgi:hypothetical protein
MEYYFFSKQIHRNISIRKVKNRVDKSGNKDVALSHSGLRNAPHISSLVVPLNIISQLVNIPEQNSAPLLQGPTG